MKRSFRDIDAVESIYILNHVCISIMANNGHNIDCIYEFQSRYYYISILNIRLA